MDICRGEEDTIDIARGEIIFSGALDISRGGTIKDDLDNSSDEEIVIDNFGGSSEEGIDKETFSGSFSGDIVREATPSTGTLSLSLSLSSDRFEFNDSAEDDDAVDCINRSGHLFAEFKKKSPTLEEILKSMDYGDKKSKELSKLFLKRAEYKLEEFDAPELTAEDIAVIYCYTFEWNKREYGKGVSPYKILNDSVSVNRNNASLKKTRGFLSMLLKALRKLPRYTPVNGVLYRGIRVHVQTEADPNAPKRKPYAPGNEKMFWSFSSTTEDLERTKNFIGKGKGTLFTISGKVWGYDISMFSGFPDEKEIILEPERKMKIKSVSREGNIIAVNTEMVKTPLVLEDLIKAKAVKIKERRSKFTAVPENFRVINITETAVMLLWSPPKGMEDEKILSYQVSVRKVGGGRLFNRGAEGLFETKKKGTRYIASSLKMGDKYEFRVRCRFDDGWGNWVEKNDFLKGDPLPAGSAWKKCPDEVDKSRKYLIDTKNPRIATEINADNEYCSIISDTYLPSDRVISWKIKVLRSENKGGSGIFVGVVPFDVDQDRGNYNLYMCGWYYGICNSVLYSGPPHSYKGKEYGPRKAKGHYVREGDTIGVVMDTTRGDLSYVVGGENLGVAYKRIPLEKPLVPCAILFWKDDSVELDPSEGERTTVSASIPIPPNITVGGDAWNSITLTWDAVEGASLYQIEVDGSKLPGASATNTFTKAGLLPESEHKFRVRTVRGNSVSEWSDSVKGRTQKAPDFSKCAWKKCPEDVDEDKKYSINKENTRIATMSGGSDYCTIIGSTPLPRDAVTSWSIKILKSRGEDENAIYVGVAPFDISQNKGRNYYKCGWYFNCHESTLYSGPPKYCDNEYYGGNARARDSVGVVVNTANGVILFKVDGVDRGVAFEGIPLNKPLVPCVLICNEGDSVELII